MRDIALQREDIKRRQRFGIERIKTPPLPVITDAQKRENALAFLAAFDSK
jgi:hypothetical protein